MTNYKRLYEQTVKIVDMYQNEIVPGLRAYVEQLEQELKEKNSMLENMEDDLR